MPEYERKVPSAEFGAGHIERYYRDHERLYVKDPTRILGAWIDEKEKDKVAFDVSVALDNLDEAIKPGIANKQKAIWDGYNMREIRMDEYTARKAEPLTPEQREAGERKIRGLRKMMMNPISAPWIGQITGEDIDEYRKEREAKQDNDKNDDEKNG